MSVQDEVPKSRLTLTYKTEVNGEPEVVDLPYRMLMLGDFSQGTSKDRSVDLEERKTRNLDGRNTDAIMKDMNISTSFVVPNQINPQEEENLRVNLPIEGMKSFSPQEVAKNIPKVRSLLLLKQLLLEVQSNVANKKEFRQLLSSLYADKDAFAQVKEEMKQYACLQLPEKETQTVGK